MEERASALTWSVCEPLRPLSVASRNATLVGDYMILNVAFLVERVREDDFDQAWPPYSFVNIRLDLDWR
jgi:hypothetical protein